MAARRPVARSFAGALELTPELLRGAPLHRPRPSALDVSLELLEGVGEKLAEAAAEAGIRTVGDLLLRVPHGHRDRTVVPVSGLEPGRQATVRVEVLADAARPFRRRGLSILTVKVGDESGSVRATWFNQPWLAQKLTRGTNLLLTGSMDKRGFRVSEYELVAPGPRVLSRERTDLVPVHPATEQLKAQRIRGWVEQAIPLAGNFIEALPAELRARRELAGVGDALHAVHFPGFRGGRRGSPRAAGVRRAIPLPGDSGYSEAVASGGAAGASVGEAGGERWAVDRVAAVRADSGSVGGVRRDRRRSGLGAADAAAADGGGRVGQDGGRALLDAAGAGVRLPGGADGAHRDAGRAARRDAGAAAGGRGDAVRAADRGDAGGAAAGGAGAAGERRAGPDRRHPRPDRARRPLRPARALRGRRAAPLRRRPAPRARRRRESRAPRPTSST